MSVLEQNLIAASKNANLRDIKEILDMNVDPNISNSEGLTPLHLVVGKGDEESTKILLESNADPNAVDLEGHTPLHLAAKNGYYNLVSILLAYGADPTITSIKGRTPLMIAQKYGHKPVMNILYPALVTVDIDHRDKVSPLHNWTCL